MSVLSRLPMLLVATSIGCSLDAQREGREGAAPSSTAPSAGSPPVGGAQAEGGGSSGGGVSGGAGPGVSAGAPAAVGGTATAGASGAGGSSGNPGGAGAGGEVERNAEGVPIEGTSTCLPGAPSHTPPYETLDLAAWGLNLPFDEDGNDGSTNDSAWMVGAELQEYVLPFYFETNSCNSGVIFRAHTGGSTTDGSGYPRSELREMTSDGEERSDWSSGSGRHTMTILQSINHLPKVKSHVVAGQIHGEGDDISVFRLEGRRLYITDGNAKLEPPIDAFYNLGTPFEARFVVENDETHAYYNGRLVRTIAKSYSGAYFKAGAYTQSACGGPKVVAGEGCDAYGEVEIFSLSVSHE